ncbi:hypothetical protein KVR01_004444 [Diaporthe batatas]|uniref:uncharacterized protein n=1 Tax=Diaporthe batatas TaxID=748121 RepID=UPI001D053BB8|nr:uncharacterized protein KVR01_004444 [Diaporthe batatas]KAG8165892.1 hypothetical protein KVR01_004444 [Diaporthe batatas]
MDSVKNKILITGASGQYGRLAVAGLLAKGVPASSLLLLTRDPAKLADYASQGSTIRQGSFDDPVDKLAEAFAGAETMLFISTSRAGKRLPQHQAAVDAASKAGIKHIVYTSILSAHLEKPTALVAREHHATEKMLRVSGLYWTALRDAQYSEALTDVAGPPALKAGVLRVNAGQGKMAFISRDDCVGPAVNILADPSSHRNKAYHITGPELLSWADAARIMGEVVGKTLCYEPLTDDEQLAIFDEMGIPREPIDGLVVNGNPWNSSDMVSFTKATALGEFEIISDDVQELTLRNPKSFREVCEERLVSLKK